METFDIACFMTQKWEIWNNKKFFPTGHVKKKNGYFPTLGGGGGGGVSDKVGKFQLFFFFLNPSLSNVIIEIIHHHANSQLIN